MTTLAEVQSGFARYLLEGDDRFANEVSSTQTLDAHSRLRIYANAYRSRLVEALSTDFPVLRIVLGDGPFERLSEDYIAAFPSTSFTLRGFGAGLPMFIESRTAILERAFAAELAAFEWALVDAFDAVDRASVGIADMAQIAPDAWPRLEIDAHPSVRHLRTRFNTPTIWNAVKAQQPLPAVTEQHDNFACVVWRQELSCVFRSMAPVENSAWCAMAGGANFAAMCDVLLDWLSPDEIPPRAAQLLHAWLVDGLIGTLRTP